MPSSSLTSSSSSSSPIPSSSTSRLPAHREALAPGSRPQPYTAATVIPSFRPSEPYQASRPRSNTASLHSAAAPTTRDRARTTTRPRPPLAFDLASISLTAPSSEKPSSPIPIPSKQKEKSQPTTPLTARGSPAHYFGFHHGRPNISDSLRPYYTTTANVSSSVPAASQPLVQRGFAVMGPRPEIPLYTPSSPLSPTLRPQSSSGNGRQKERRPHSLNIAGLPKFHPANFPEKDSSPAAHSPRKSRFGPSQPRSSRGSDAQQKLHQYQREMIASATQGSRSLLLENISNKPSPPRLTPLRSPGGQMTPLALEGQNDYLLAGATSIPTGFSASDGREMVEQLVRRENERRNHPEARSGSVSPALSPALSPAVSLAGGRG